MDYYKFFYWDFPNFLKSIKCFWVGHDERMGCEEDYETSYCARCNIGWPQDIYTWPTIKENLYWFIIEWLDDLHKGLDEFNRR